MTRGARLVAALAGVFGSACGGHVAHETDAGADGAVDTGTVDTGAAVDTGAVDTGAPPKSPGTCTGGGAAISCAPGRTCSASSTALTVVCDDAVGRPPGKHCGVIFCDISCTCTSAPDSTCDCPIAVPGPMPPPELGGSHRASA